MSQAAEIAVFVFCVSLLVIYNILYFTKTLAWLSIRVSIRGRRYLSLWVIGRESRAVWAEQMMRHPSEAIVAAQSIRNMVLGTSILAAAMTLLAGQMIAILTNASSLQQITSYGGDDPIAGEDSFMAPQTKIGLTLGVLFLALLSFAQCIRLAVHLTFLLRAASTDDSQRSRRFYVLAFAINKRASLFFSVGLRFSYAAFVFFFLVLGITTFLVATLVEITALLIMDLTPYRKEYEGADKDNDDLVEEERSRFITDHP